MVYTFNTNVHIEKENAIGKGVYKYCSYKVLIIWNDKISKESRGFLWWYQAFI